MVLMMSTSAEGEKIVFGCNSPEKIRTFLIAFQNQVIRLNDGRLEGVRYRFIAGEVEIKMSPDEAASNKMIAKLEKIGKEALQ